MSERYVRPPLLAREPKPAWRAVWRFRLMGLVAMTLLVLAAFLGFRALSETAAQDPGLNSSGPLLR